MGERCRCCRCLEFSRLLLRFANLISCCSLLRRSSSSELDSFIRAALLIPSVMVVVMLLRWEVIIGGEDRLIIDLTMSMQGIGCLDGCMLAMICPIMVQFVIVRRMNDVITSTSKLL